MVIHSVLNVLMKFNFTGYGDPPGFGVAPQPAAGYGGQGDGQAYAAQPGGGYQRPSVSSGQSYHPYRR